mmetsp:Transcript_13838/g.21085  ORF Transcript_13838/g.21085 Transcript_13838/m.21085 type:complete len:269 (+) Transcript_13838:117-923(+)|eukprot:CAMPEP_0178927754 /NCGR_PEP_ID=MMETSP0786-20121207/19410_1 /TAXON_ID=186022 /ORGANISM="Thalassionema frauenfeldii, Strain CCMP 1798" /LENGTH=268 /DNA_ID=CAMNT_0020603315 /DNA_START=40 /DNA_END=846 /DNA_ORIENTATION=+
MQFSLSVLTALTITSVGNAFVAPTLQNTVSSRISIFETASVLSAESSPSSRMSPLFSTIEEVDGKGIDLMAEADNIFDSVDTNKDGVISADELKDHLVNTMGYTQEYTKYLFSSLDTDSDGEITKEEMRFAFYNFEALAMYMTFGVGGSDITSRDAFKTFVSNQSSGPNDTLLLNDLADLIFDMIDTDNSGEIDRDELEDHFAEVTAKFPEESTETQAKEYVKTMFAALDKNKDGKIEKEEMREAFQLYDFKLLAKTFGLKVYRTASV